MSTPSPVPRVLVGLQPDQFTVGSHSTIESLDDSIRLSLSTNRSRASRLIGTTPGDMTPMCFPRGASALNVAATERVEWIRTPGLSFLLGVRERLPLGGTSAPSPRYLRDDPADFRGHGTRRRSGPSTRVAPPRTGCGIRRSTSGGSCSSATSTGSPPSARHDMSNARHMPNAHH